jgi:hypothetical protein
MSGPVNEGIEILRKRKKEKRKLFLQCLCWNGKNETE